jgi:hypothetical protein
MRRVLLSFLVGGSMMATALGAEPPKSDPALPDDFIQLMPRGKIPAIDEPQFVTAAEADIEDDAWVLGVEINGQAKAYSLNLLNRHEVVNDRFGDRPVAAVW